MSSDFLNVFYNLDMNKSINFSGIPVIKQILKYILPVDISRTTEKYKSDRYYKSFLSSTMGHPKNLN